jgi:hypothetical protein
MSIVNSKGGISKHVLDKIIRCVLKIDRVDLFLSACHEDTHSIRKVVQERK